MTIENNTNKPKKRELPKSPETSEIPKKKLTKEEQSRAIQQELAKIKRHIQILSQKNKQTADKLNKIRTELNLHPTDEDPPSIACQKETIQALRDKSAQLKKKLEKTNQSRKKGKQQEQKEGKELKENDLIVSDLGIESIKKLLKKNNIQYKETEHKKRQVLDAKTNTAVPGEFVLTIFDPEHPDKPASFDFVKQVFQLIKDSNVAVRYGKNPEKKT